jgi:hypothetical protein
MSSNRFYAKHRNFREADQHYNAVEKRKALTDGRKYALFRNYGDPTAHLHINGDWAVPSTIAHNNLYPCGEAFS